MKKSLTSVLIITYATFGFWFCKQTEALPSPYECDKINCTEQCVYGLEKDETGCPICKCFEPCKNLKCPNGSECQSILMSETGTYSHKCFTPSGDVKCTEIECIKCEFGFEKDEDGCNVCKCHDPCMEMNCPNGEKCVALETGKGECQPGKKCSEFQCRMNCPFGFSMDDKGCIVCSCAADPCLNVICPSNAVCNTTNIDGTFIATCTTKPSVICPLLNCPGSKCEFGQERDVDGCETCPCSNPCANVNCGKGTKCIPHKVGVGNIFLGNCVKDCPNVTCNLICKFGKNIDSNGCETCSCFNPCQNISCPSDGFCQVMKVDNTYIGYCSTSDCMTEECTLPCKFGYTKDNDDCLVCGCATNPCEGENCSEGYECRSQQLDKYFYTGKCKQICALIQCDNYCKFGYDKDDNGCLTCNCLPNPCSNTTCDFGSKCVPTYLNSPECAVIDNPCLELECRLECQGRRDLIKYQLNCSSCHCDNPCIDSNCGNKMCYLMRGETQITNDEEIVVTTGSCRDETCPPLSCDTSCSDGFKKDKYGCQTCQCRIECDKANCSPGQYCTSQMILSGTPPVFNELKEIASCHECPDLKCSKNCLFGWKDCQGCNCAQNPCLSAAPKPGNSCQPLFFPIYSKDQSNPSTETYQDYIYLGNGTGRCSELKARYLNYFNISDPLNCDTDGNFKPIQCSGDMCWCLDGEGRPMGGQETEHLSTILCGYYSKEYLSMFGLDDMSVILDDFLLKTELSKQLAKKLETKEQNVIITSIKDKKSAKINLLILTSTVEESNKIMKNIQSISGSSLNITIEGENFKFLLNGTNIFSQSPPPSTITNPPSPKVQPTQAATPSDLGEPEDMTRLLLLVILLPILLLLFVVLFAVLIGIYVIKKLNRRPKSPSSLSKEPIVFPEDQRTSASYDDGTEA